jgi:hypothetical protein
LAAVAAAAVLEDLAAEGLAAVELAEAGEKRGPGTRDQGLGTKDWGLGTGD